MTSVPLEPPAQPGPTDSRVTVHRQPVVRPDRSVHGYAISVVLQGPPDGGAEDADAALHAAYGRLDLAALAGGAVVFLRATAAMLVGDHPLPLALGGLVLEVPARFADHPDAAGHLRRLRAGGVGLALADYVPGGRPDALVPLADFLKVDLARGAGFAFRAMAWAREFRVAVVAEHVDSEAAALFCTTHGAELLQGPLFHRDITPIAHEFTAGQVQCLEVVALLMADDVDTRRVIQFICADPEFAMRVLGLINSIAAGCPTRIDSIPLAVVWLGTQQLLSLTMVSLIGARNYTVARLWYVLARAVACRSLADNDVAYTVGLLSAVAAQLKIPPAALIARTRVSRDVGDALLTRSGPYGRVLAAVLAHEENNIAGVEATGLCVHDVADAYLDAVADALGTATALATSLQVRMS